MTRLWEEAGGQEAGRTWLCCRVQTLPEALKSWFFCLLAKQNSYARQIWFKACQFVVGVNVRIKTLNSSYALVIGLIALEVSLTHSDNPRFT